MRLFGYLMLAGMTSVLIYCCRPRPSKTSRHHCAELSSFAIIQALVRKERKS